MAGYLTLANRRKGRRLMKVRGRKRRARRSLARALGGRMSARYLRRRRASKPSLRKWVALYYRTQRNPLTRSELQTLRWIAAYNARIGRRRVEPGARGAYWGYASGMLGAARLFGPKGGYQRSAAGEARFLDRAVFAKFNLARRAERMAQRRNGGRRRRRR